MTCYLYSSLKTALKPCGHRCYDIKSYLLSISGTSEKDLLQEIFEKLYFNEIPERPSQKKCVIKFDRDILTDSHIQLFALMEGDDNLAFHKLFHKMKNCEHMYGACCLKFGRIQLFLIPYNKCFCDGCLSQNLLRFPGASRIVVFHDFFIPVYQYKIPQPSLIQSAIKSLLKPIDCCEVQQNRRHVIWLGDGDSQISSQCKLRYGSPTLKDLTSFTCANNFGQFRFTRSMKQEPLILSWENLILNKYYLIVDVQKDHLHLFNKLGYIVIVTNYPKNIGNYFDRASKDIFFVKRDINWFYDFCVKVYNKDYSFTKSVHYSFISVLHSN